MAFNREKLLISGASLCLILVFACFAFLGLDSKLSHRTSEVQPTSSRPERDATARQISTTSPPTAIHHENASGSAPSDRIEQITSLAAKVDELSTEVSSLKDMQWRLEALIHNLAVSVGKPGVNVPSYEEHQDRLAKYGVELDAQKQTVESLRCRAVEVTRILGMPESSVDADLDKELELPGRDVSEFVQARAKLLNAKKILEAMEKRLSHAKQLYTLPPAHSGR